MMQKRVKHLILPSRDGVGSPAAAEMMRELQANGVQVVAPTCDAASIESLRTVLNECYKSMPPVKGCINAAMVLQVSRL
jgi:outer membrane lipopolysaccharide assembly protein LptE/RlpB